MPGGGVAYLRTLTSLNDLKGANDDQNVGIDIIRRAIEAPLRQIVTNAGGEASVVANEVRNGSGAYGYNARTDEYGDMFAMGVIDPTKVSRVALENAASVSGLLLTTEATIVEKEEEKAPAMPDMGGMGGMGGMM